MGINALENKLLKIFAIKTTNLTNISIVQKLADFFQSHSF